MRWAECRYKKTKKQYVSQRDRYRCNYCKKSLRLTNDRTIDHILPKSKGGNGYIANLALCCKNCNNKKNSNFRTRHLLLLIKNVIHEKVSLSRVDEYITTYFGTKVLKIAKK